MAQNGHNLARFNRGFQCSKCRIVRGLKNFGYWAKNQCRPRPPISLIIQQRKIDRVKNLTAERAEPVASEQESKRARQQQGQGQHLCNGSNPPAQRQQEQSEPYGAAPEQESKKARRQQGQGQHICNDSNEPAHRQLEQGNPYGGGQASKSNKEQGTPALSEATVARL